MSQNHPYKILKKKKVFNPLEIMKDLELKLFVKKKYFLTIIRENVILFFIIYFIATS